MGISEYGLLYSWGDNKQGALGLGKKALLTPVPKKVEFTDDDTKIKFCSAGFSHSTAITTNGVVYSWGMGTCGRTGHGETTNWYFPKSVDQLEGENIVSVNAGYIFCKLGLIQLFSLMKMVMYLAVVIINTESLD